VYLCEVCEEDGGPADAIQLPFLFAPGTISVITWLARNEDRRRPIKHGLGFLRSAMGAARPNKRAGAELVFLAWVSVGSYSAAIRRNSRIHNL